MHEVSYNGWTSSVSNYFLLLRGLLAIATILVVIVATVNTV